MRPSLAAGSSSERSMLVGFEYVEGAVGTLWYSWEVPSSAKGLRLSKIYGRVGTITFESNGLWVLCHGSKRGSTFRAFAISRVTARCGQTSFAP